jgi:hypothetical protein
MAAIRPLTENTRAVRAAVSLMLAGRPCDCGQADWHDYADSGQIRHLSCRSCGRTGKLGPDTVQKFIEKATT